MKIINMIRQILAPKYKVAALILIVLMSFSAILEIISLGMLMPLVTSFTNPKLFETNKYLKMIYDFVNPDSLQQFMIYSAMAMIAVYVLKNIYNFCLFYTQSYFTKKLTLNITNRVYQNNINQPYEYFLERDNSEIINKISNISTFGQLFMIPLFIIGSELIVFVVLTGTILIIMPQIAILAFLVSVLVIGGLYLFTNKKIISYGKDMHIAGTELYMLLSLTFNAIKEIKLSKTETFFRKRIHEVQESNMSAMKHIFDWGAVPRMMLETLTVVMAMSILIILLKQDMGFTRIVFMAAFFLGAMFRLLPSLTRMQHNLYSVKQYSYLFTLIYESLYAKTSETHKKHYPEDFIFREKLSLEDISFKYHNGNGKMIINHLDLDIKPLECVAFTGLSGCGKTTLIDLICGLLKPCGGRITVDGVDLQDILYPWQRSIGYVPQDTILFNMTLKENIALGIPPEKIDMERLSEAIKLARIEDFVESLPEGLETRTGGQNIRLSGGQKQRIAIARALYRNPRILILDEATSALDAETEEAFAQSIRSLKGKVTILMIAHREKMIEVCDRRIYL